MTYMSTYFMSNYFKIYYYSIYTFYFFNWNFAHLQKFLARGGSWPVALRNTKAKQRRARFVLGWVTVPGSNRGAGSQLSRSSLERG